MSVSKVIQVCGERGYKGHAMCERSFGYTAYPLSFARPCIAITMSGIIVIGAKHTNIQRFTAPGMGGFLYATAKHSLCREYAENTRPVRGISAARLYTGCLAPGVAMPVKHVNTGVDNGSKQALYTVLDIVMCLVSCDRGLSLCISHNSAYPCAGWKARTRAYARPCGARGGGYRG